jgi:hypothetical protein
MNELAILGTGAVTPSGLGWPGLAPGANPTPASLDSLRRPGRAFPVLPVSDESLRAFAREPRLRRASRITLMMAAAARQALNGETPGRLGLVGAFFTGPCHFSRLFFQPVIEQGPTFASPALFPETVYNSSLSHVAHLVGVDGAAYAAVGDDSAWVTALQIASVWLELGTADRVLVIGAEELDVSAIEAYAAAGWMKHGFLPSEGAAAILLGRPRSDAEVRVSALLDGIAYRSRASARLAAREAFAAMTGAPILATAAGTWMQAEEARASAGRDSIDLERPHLGHAFTATAGWNTLHGIRHLAQAAPAPDLWVPVWGLHHQISALRLRAVGRPQLAVTAPAG